MTHKPFLLAVRAIVLDANQKILVVQRSFQSTYNPGRWEIPGGKCDPNESLDQALAREVLEETGLSLKILGVLGTTEWGLKDRQIVELIFKTEAVTTDVTISDEHEAFQWIDQDQLNSIKFPEHFTRFFNSSKSNLSN